MKAKTAAESLLTIVAAAVGLVLLNALVCTARSRVDLTERKIYTLSDASQKIVSKITEKLHIKAYFGGVPPEHADRQQYVENLLTEYADASGGKVTWEKIEVDQDKKEKLEELAKDGIRPTQLGSMKNDKIEVGLVTFAVQFSYLDKKEVWNADQSFFGRPLEGMEYEFSTLIKRLVVKKKKVGITTGFGEPAQAQALQHPKIGLGDSYDVTPINWQTTPKDIGTVDLLVVNGPTQKVSDAAKYYLDQHIMNGKGVLFLVPGMHFEGGGNPQMPPEMQQGDQPFLGTPAQHGLNDLLAQYGFEVEPDVVIDGRNGAPGIIPLGQQTLVSQIFFPLTQVMVAGHGEILDGLEYVAMPFSSTMKLVGPLASGKIDGGELHAMLKSTGSSFRQKDALAITRGLKLDPKPEDRGPFILAYAAANRWTSFYADKPKPEGVDAPDAPKPEEGSELMSAPAPGDTLKESPPGTRIIVVAGSEFAEDKQFEVMRMLGTKVYLNGFTAVHNWVDWLAQDTDLVSVRGKVVARPIQGLEKGDRLAIKYGNVVGAPLALILFGVVWWQIRERRRRNLRLP